MTSSVGGFASGLLQGMSAADDRRRNKRVDRMFDQRARAEDIRVEGQKNWLEKQGYDTSKYEWDIEVSEPFLVRAFQKLKNWAGGGSQAADTAASEQAAPRRALPVQTLENRGDIGYYADGGEVDEDELPRRRMAMDVDAPYAAETGQRGPAIEPEPYMDKPLHERIAPGLSGTIPEVAGQVKGRWQDYRNADTNEERGRAARNLAGEVIVGAGSTLSAATGDALGAGADSGWGGMGEWLAGFVGLGGTKENRQPDPATPPPNQPADPSRRAVSEAMGPPEASDEEMAQAATSTAVKNTPGHPDNPDQQFDYSEMVEVGMKADDIPYVGVEDWNQYRRDYIEYGITQGMSPAEANAQVDQIQQRGFISSMQQASYHLMRGDARAAALAARAAYQYFPNGKDVRVATMEGVNGKPVVVGYGVDENGEMVGTPQVLTVEYLNAMVANFSNPQAFNAWKADKDAALRLEREYAESRPQREAELEQTRAQTDYLRSGAEKNRADAAHSRSGRGGGLTQADRDRAFKEIMQFHEMRSMEDEALATELAKDMSLLYIRYPQLGYPAIIDLVMDVHNGEYTLQEGLRKLEVI